MKRLRRKAARWLALALLAGLLSGCASPRDRQAPPETRWMDLGGAYRQGASRLTGPRADEGRHRVMILAASFDATISSLDYYLRGMASAGWITENPLEDESVARYEGAFDGAELGPYVELADGRVYDLAARGEAAESALERHTRAGDLDLIVAVGTSAARLAKRYAGDTVPVLAFPLADAVGSGVAKGVEYSGIPNLWAYTDPEHYQRQLALYHSLFPFRRLGLVYYDEGLGGRAAYRQAAQKLGVALVERRIPPPPVSGGDAGLRDYRAALDAACEELLEREGIDVFILTTQLLEPGREAAFFERFYQREVPVFVQTGEPLIEKGGLIMQESLDEEEVGRLVADVTARVLRGEAPGDLRQDYVCTPYTVVNQEAARELGIRLPFELLLSCEKIY